MRDVSDLMEFLLFVGVVAAGIAGFVWMIRSMRRGSATTYDLCEECGYDMRATPERCPECGWRRPRFRLGPGRVDVQKLLETAPHDPVTLRRPDLDEELVMVFESDFADDVLALAEHLEARGIACEVVDCESSMQQGARLGRVVYQQLWVWSKDKQDAAALVALAKVTEAVPSRTQSPSGS